MDVNQISSQLQKISPFMITGTITETAGMTACAAGFPVPYGAIAEIQRADGSVIQAEVIGFRDHTSILFPYGNMHGIRRGDQVYLRHTSPFLRVSTEMCGKILNAQGKILSVGKESDKKSEKNTSSFSLTERVPYVCTPPPAHERPRITEILSTGVRVIDALLTVGRGQRVGIFAGSGVGKSVLLGMIARYTEADVIVIGLIGERGREVNDFIQRELGEHGLKKSVLVVATSDEPAIMKVRAAQTATAVAEYFRNQGKNVLLLMDSLTRVAMAQRDIGLAAGETAVTRGYPPSVFALLPPLVERAGRTMKGDITAIYTVLVEGDDENEIIADTVRSLLDGHIWLSRKIAARGQYPAVDVLASISRLMPDICDACHQESANKLRRMLALWKEKEDVITLGVYRSGTNPELDRVIATRENVLSFLKQDVAVSCDLDTARQQLLSLVSLA
ncbi:MAG: FliI/YscN family ATPase [Planctomycetia bacterium]|nr:FliI/YscN family ATPase [Planctomycetia bacterium]